MTAISNDKYESTGEVIQRGSQTLYRIRAKRDFADVKAGELGGWIANEDNLAIDGNAWVYGNARVSTPILMATRSDNYAFVCAPTPDGPRIMAGCRYVSFEEARDHWKNTRGGTQLGDESLAIVDFLERMAAIRGFVLPTAQEAAE